MNYLTVPKFAEKIGITKQAIYQRIKRADPDFLKFILKDKDGIKISEDAMSLFNAVNVDLDIKQEPFNTNSSSKQNENNDDKHSEDISINIDHINNKEIITRLEAEIKDLKQQIHSMLDIQNKQLDQINRLYDQIEDKDKLIAEQSQRILEQTRLPVIVEPPKQTLWEKIKLKLFKS